MTKQSPVTASAVALVRTGLFASRICARCGRGHFALTIAPDAAPCRRCAERTDMKPFTDAERAVLAHAGVDVDVREVTCPITGDLRHDLVAIDDDRVAGIALSMPGYTALLHRSPSRLDPPWRFTTLTAAGPWGHTNRNTLVEVLRVARAEGFRITGVRTRRASVACDPVTPSPSP